MPSLFSRRTYYLMRKYSAIIAVLYLICLIVFLLPEPEEVLMIRREVGIRQLPIHYWRHLSQKPAGFFNESCTAPPSVENIEIVQGFWQRVNAAGVKMYVFSAYWDERGRIPWVRVLMYSEKSKLPPLYCQLWYEHESRPIIVRATVTYSFVGRPKDGTSEPYILSCLGRREEYQNADHMLMAVSIVTSPCNRATALLTVQYTREKLINRNRTNIKEEDSIAVCLVWRPEEWKKDYSARLIEWIELLKQFGTKHVYVYVPKVHPKVLRVVFHYVKRNFVSFSPLTLPPEGDDTLTNNISEEAKRKRVLIAYNDCLYSAMNFHKWVAMLNIDDLLVPDRDQSYITMIYRELKELKEKPDFKKQTSTDGFVFEPFWVPSFAQLKVTGNITRTPFLSSEWRAPLRFGEGWRHRFFFNLDTLMALMPHQPLFCIKSSGLPRDCTYRHISPSTALVRQYSTGCGNISTVICENIEEKVIQDETLYYIRDDIQERVDTIIDEIGLEKPNIEYT